MQGIFVVSLAAFFVQQTALAANYTCRLLADGQVKASGVVNTSNAQSGISFSDAASGLVVACATITDGNGRPMGVIGCGVMTPIVYARKVFLTVDTSWEAVSYASDTAPRTGVIFNARTDDGAVMLAGTCTL